MRRGKELATLPQKGDGPGQVSSLTGTTQRTDRIWDLPFSYHFTSNLIQSNCNN